MVLDLAGRRSYGAMLALAFVCTSVARGSTAKVAVTVEPAVIQLHQSAAVAVRGATGGAAVEVRLRGASTPSGVLLPWTRLRPAHGKWVGRVGAPSFRGVYPLEVRIGPGGASLTDDTWLVRVLPPGTLARPAFDTPDEVVAWWVADVAHGTIAGVRPWPLLPYDRRDPRLHRLFVVSYDPAGATGPGDRLGIWITAVRDGYRGQWRLLEATVQP